MTQLPLPDPKLSQEERILLHLKSGKSITPLEALNLFGCFRLGGRIYDLKKQNYQIEKTMVETSGGARVASYKLAPDAPLPQPEGRGSFAVGMSDREWTGRILPEK